MNENLPDLERFLQPHIRPGFAAVDALVHAVAVRNRVARVGLACAQPDEVRVRLAHGDIADRDRRLRIELMVERGAVVHGLEQPARSRCNVVRRRVRIVNRECRDAPAHVRGADATPRHLFQNRLGQRPCGRFRNRRRRRCRRGLGFRLREFLLQVGDLLFDRLDVLLLIRSNGQSDCKCEQHRKDANAAKFAKR